MDSIIKQATEVQARENPKLLSIDRKQVQYDRETQDIDAERAVLGSLLVRPGAIHEISDIITARSFYYDKFGIIYDTMIELSLRSEPIDVLSVTNRLREKRSLDQVGGQAEVVDLAQAVPASTNVRYYAEIVQKKYVLRSVMLT